MPGRVQPIRPPALAPSGLYLPPHLYPPAGAQSKNLFGYISNPAPGAQAVIFAFTVPNTMRLFMNQIGNNFVASGFTDGSGLILWQIWDNGNPIEDYEAIAGSLGGVSSPSWLSAPIIFEEGHTVSFVVINTVGSPIPEGSGLVGATLRGYYANRLDCGGDQWAV
jgi:hypothetical protein